MFSQIWISSGLKIHTAETVIDDSVGKIEKLFKPCIRNTRFDHFSALFYHCKLNIYTGSEAQMK